ncbi:protein kinase C delta type-like [Xenopus laevis]|uniref:Protein kinase C delta type-like n=1 Tax=Xenopus laevis TaxID=8355 RepID=A0A8J1KRA2_XENLA|nr:protein kinase C delta type-like [Xenopus laevis]
MGEKMPPAMEKSTPPIRSEEKDLLIPASIEEMEKKKKVNIRMKRKMDNEGSTEGKSRRKRKEKVKRHQCSDYIKEEEEKEGGRKRPQSNEGTIKTEEVEKKNTVNIRMKRKMDSKGSTEGKSGEKRKKKAKRHQCSEKEGGRKRPHEDTTKAEEGGSGQKRPLLEDDIPLPEAVSRCKIHAELGSGSYGKVLLASLPNKSEHVAIKVMKKGDYIPPTSIIEANVLKIAAGCPYLCHSYGAFHTQWHSVFVMEYVNGGTLHDQMNNIGLPRMDTLIFYAAEMVCGLQFLHENGIIHRDLKPANVLVTSEGHLKICDFGLAAEGISGNKKTRGLVGTLPYMAPELLKEKEYDAGIDWWSLGVNIYLMATGSHPFYKGDNMMEFSEAILHTELHIPEYLSQELEDLLTKLLNKDPKERLGCNGNIREHPFFHSIDWVNLEKGNVPLPYKPEAMPSVDFSKTYEETLSFLESIKQRISSRYITPDVQLAQPSHFFTNEPFWNSQAQQSAPYYRYHQAPFGPSAYNIQPYPAYSPNLYPYQWLPPSGPISGPYYHHLAFGRVNPPLVPWPPNINTAGLFPSRLPLPNYNFPHVW